MASKKNTKETKNTKKIEIPEEQQKKLFMVAVITVIILSLLLIISRNFGAFDNVRLRKNNKTIFSVTDLTLNNLKFADNEKTIKKELGEPKKTKTVTKGVYQYKIYYYDGLTLTLKENYKDFILVRVEVTSRKYKVARKLKVNKSIVSAMKKFKVQNSTGTYIYGNYSSDAIGSSEITECVFFGVRNKNEVAYVNRDAIVGDITPNIAKLNISYKHGRITKITWSYDFQ